MNIQKISLPATSDQLKVRAYPQAIKYMGSKAKIIDFVADGVRQVHRGGAICDLFAGAGSLAGALGNEAPFISNDIQHYSGVVSRCYLGRVSPSFHQIPEDEIMARGLVHFEKTWKGLPNGLFYHSTDDLDEFNQIELRNQQLVNSLVSAPYTIFTRCYSGTWWSAEQCAWIDALRRTADEMKAEGLLDENDFAVFLTAIMHAMAYCSQGTGHFAQYRDAKTVSSMQDISIYRRKSFPEIFKRKLTSFRDWNFKNVQDGNDFRITSVDYEDCLATLKGGTIYADPPYAFVHYSRFYHALETLVLYDYPELQFKGGKVVKGRYRNERHQSPFSIKTKVPKAFEQLFAGANASKSNLVLSYSDTGLFELPDLLELVRSKLGAEYTVETKFMAHKHMTMGRSEDRDRNVQEALVLAQYNSI